MRKRQGVKDKPESTPALGTTRLLPSFSLHPNPDPDPSGSHAKNPAKQLPSAEHLTKSAVGSKIKTQSVANATFHAGPKLSNEFELDETNTRELYSVLRDDAFVVGRFVSRVRFESSEPRQRLVEKTDARLLDNSNCRFRKEHRW